MLYALIILSFMLPICTITAFVVGYNVNATKKIMKIGSKNKKLTENEQLLHKIDNASVY